jgi:hypothetical protein
MFRVTADVRGLTSGTSEAFRVGQSPRMAKWTRIGVVVLLSEGLGSRESVMGRTVDDLGRTADDRGRAADDVGRTEDVVASRFRRRGKNVSGREKLGRGHRKSVRGRGKSIPGRGKLGRGPRIHFKTRVAFMADVRFASVKRNTSARLHRLGRQDRRDRHHRQPRANQPARTRPHLALERARLIG